MKSGFSANGKQALDSGLIHRVNCRGAHQAELRLVAFVAHHVGSEGLEALYFARASQLEALLGTGVGFKFSHCMID